MTRSETKMEIISKKALTQRHSDYRLRQSCVGFVLTERCPVGCRHCINDSTMKTSRPRDLTKQLEWIAAVGKSGLCENVNVTGGEPFLNFEDLVILIRTIRDHHMHPTLVTSAVWATDDDITRLKLERLAAAGLNGIAVSADEFHQENVPLANVARVLAESRSRGIALGISLAYMENSDTPTRKVRALKRDLGLELLRDVTIVKGPIIKAGRARNLSWGNSPPGHKVPSHLICPAVGLLVKQDGIVVSCCGAQLPQGSPFILGDLNSESFTEVYQRFTQHPLIPFVETWGLADMLDRLLEAGLAVELSHYKGAEEGFICELCQRIFSNPTYVAFFLAQNRDPAVRRQLGILKLMMYGDSLLLQET